MITPNTGSVRQEGNVWICDTGYVDSAGNPIEIRVDNNMVTGHATNIDWQNWARDAGKAIGKAAPSVGAQLEVTLIMTSIFYVYNQANPLTSSQEAAVSLASGAAAALVTSTLYKEDFTETFLTNVIGDFLSQGTVP
jgi:hypothetical protein